MQWKGPYEVVGTIGENDYRVKVNEKVRTYHANLLKIYNKRNEETPDAVHIACVGVVDFEECEKEDIDLGEDVIVLGSCTPKESVKDIKIGPEIEEDKRSEIKEILSEFKHVFTDLPGKMDIVQHEINLTSQVPIKSKPYSIPYALRETLKKEVSEMLKW